NGQTGLYISSNGSVSTTNLTASLNLDDGVFIDTIGLTAPQSVSIKGNNWFSQNGNFTGESGLTVNSDGKITANNLNAMSNYSYGAYLDNYANWSIGTFATFGSISLTGNNSFTYSTQASGLAVNTHGTVSLSNVAASF